MRHGADGGRSQPCPVAALAFGVALSAPQTALVLGSRRPEAPPARLGRTLPAAVALAAVTQSGDIMPITVHRERSRFTTVFIHVAVRN
jgi:hypothetical protein